MAEIEKLSPLVVGQLIKSVGIVYPVNAEWTEVETPVCTKMLECGHVIIDYGEGIDNAPMNTLQLKKVRYLDESGNVIVTNRDSPKERFTVDDLYKIAFPDDPIQKYFAGIYQEIENKYKKRLADLERVNVNYVKPTGKGMKTNDRKTNKNIFRG